MAIETIPNQPVYFGDLEDNCFCEEAPYKQLVNFGDITQFQVKLNACYNAVNLALNGDFATDSVWEKGARWSIAGGVAVCIPGLQNQIIYQALGYTNYGIYQVTFTVVVTAGSLTCRIGLSTELITVTSSGTYTVTGTNDFIPLFGFYPDAEFAGTIDNVYVYEIDKRFIVGIFDNEDNFVTKISYLDHPDYFTLDKDTLTVQIDWETLLAGEYGFGCYYLCIFDPCINTNSQNGILNGDFTITEGWTENNVSGDTQVEITDGKAVFLGFAAGVQQLVSDTILTAGITYTIYYTVTSISNGDFHLLIDGVQGISRVTANSYAETFTPFHNTNLILEASFGLAGSVFVDNVSIEITDGNDYTCNLRSNTFKIGNHECSIRINACNDEDGLGFNFTSSGFSPVIRLTAGLINAQYPVKRKTDVDSAGKASVLYGTRRKTKKLIIEGQPEYVHDFLSLLLLFDRFYIGSTAYFSEDDEYQVVYNDNEVNFGSAVIDISEKTQLTRNLNIGNEETNCAIGDNFWIDEFGNFIMDGSDGGLTIIN